MFLGRIFSAIACVLSLSLAVPLAAQKSPNKASRRDRPVAVERSAKATRVYQDPAFARGESDGYARGLDDGRSGERYDPARHAAYRDGDGGYAAEYGPRAGYKTNYRDGFRQGYEDGYRKGTRTAR
jgi:hypothetical protein